jgi:hypothetical protein
MSHVCCICSDYYRYLHHITSTILPLNSNIQLHIYTHHPFIHLFIHPFIRLFIHLTFHLSIHVFIHPSFYLSIRLFIYSFIHLSIHLSIYSSIHHASPLSTSSLPTVGLTALTPIAMRLLDRSESACQSLGLLLLLIAINNSSGALLQTGFVEWILPHIFNNLQ